jgi:hypothetical protein
MGADEFSISDSEIINGGGDSVLCTYANQDDCRIDLENNDWGTDSQAQIEEWISDSNDDPERCCEVDFLPFVGGPVPVEPRDWSSLKEMYRDR